MKRAYRFLIFLLSIQLVSTQLGAQTYVFAKLTGSPVDISGWNPQGTCAIGNTPNATGDSEIILTEPVAGASGSIFYKTPINLSKCLKWYAEFDFRMFDGTQADGLTFCYLDNPPVGAVSGGGLGTPPTANGLKVCFDTWLNCGNEAVPKIELRWGTGYNECNGQPTRNNNDGALSFIRGNNYNHCKIEYDNGNISVFVNNVLYLTGYQTFNFAGYFGFTASTGGSNDRHSIKNVIIYTDMPPSAPGSNTAICSSDSAQLGGAFNSAYTYSWTPALGLSSTNTSNPKVSLINNGIDSYVQTYYVETDFANRPGCASKDSVLVKVYGRPTPNLTYSKSCNFPAAITFTDASIMGDGLPNTFNHFWGFGDVNATTTNPDTATGTAVISHNYPNAGPFGVWHTIKTITGNCRSDTFIQIQPQLTKPVASLQVPLGVCLGNSASFTGNGTTAVGNITKWFWNFGDGITSNLQNPNHTFTTAGNFIVTLIIENTIGCQSDTVQATITVYPLPTVAFTAPLTDCQNNLIPFTSGSLANAGTITSWSWLFGDGGVADIENPTHRYFTYGTVSVSLTVVTDKGCTASANQPLLIHPAPAIDFTVSANCAGSNAQFTNLSQIALGSQNDLRFLWRFNDAGSSPANPDSSLQIQTTHTFNTGGIYNIQLQATSPFNCVAIFNKPVTIVGKPILDLQFNQNNCSNSIQSFTDATTVPFGMLASRTLFWDWENATMSSVVDNAPAMGKTYQHTFASFGGNNARRIVIKNIATTANSCITERYDTIQLLPVPQLAFDSLPAICFSPDILSIAQARETSGMIGTGRYSGNGVSATGLFDVSQAGAGLHRMAYIFTPTNGCTDTIYSTLKVNSLPTAFAGTTKTIIAGGSTLLEGVVSANTALIQWNPTSTLNNATIARPLASPVYETMYTLMVTSSENCVAKDSALVKVLPALKVPNVFSPNKDGINDVWNIPYLSSYLGCTMDIFDRYGRKIFSSVGYNSPWDATLHGKDLPNGVYYYRLDIRNGTVPINGSVTVIR